jgi:threonine dehydrogenase-like Zn-dependent dehydrogenase
VDLNPIILNEIEVIGASFGPIPEAIAMLGRREVEVLSLISKRMKLEDGPTILKTAAQESVMKVIVDP